MSHTFFHGFLDHFIMNLQLVVIDVIKMEHEFDPLAIERCINSDIEEQKTLSEERNVLDITDIKTECMDHSYDVKTEITFDDIPVPNEAEEGNLSGQHMPGIKVEFVDDSHRVTSEIKVEEGRVPFDFSLVKCEGFPVLKCEAKEDSFDVERVQQEQKVKVSSEEDGVLIERLCYFCNGS
ncbi:uncharacterized protein [Periplaneta americana]|uniref:uncharacterized protein n=1 Tax=Periplaneta americana TaxID=6978 RepID=UPI0037E9349D